MSDKKVLNQERVMEIIKAAEAIRLSFDSLSAEIDMLRTQGDREVSIDFLYETFAKYRPPTRAIVLIASEKAHFEARWSINNRARKGMKSLYDKRNNLAIDLPDPQPEEINSPVEETTRIAANSDLPESPTLADYHEFIYKKFGPFVVAKGEIARAIREVQPTTTDETILALIKQLIETPVEGKKDKFWLDQAGPEILQRVRINDR